MMTKPRLKRFERKGFRHAFVRAHLASGIAHQIRALRQRRGWSQGELAGALKLKGQSAVVRLEDSAYGRHSLATLLRLGEAFDVALLVKFVPFSRFLREVEDVSPRALAIDNFEQESARLTEAATVPTRHYRLAVAASGSSRRYARSSLPDPTPLSRGSAVRVMGRQPYRSVSLTGSAPCRA